MVETPKFRSYQGKPSQEGGDSPENERSKSLATDGSGPYDPTMESRVTRLETHMEYVRIDLSEIKLSVKELTKSVVDLASVIKELPTKDDLWSWKIQWLAIGLAEFAIIVGAIVGGLDWIKTH